MPGEHAWAKILVGQMFIQRLFPSLTSFTLIKNIQIDMTKTITVCGATGTVGNSVALRLLKEGWKVRAITRNKSSDAAKALFEAGAELATADYNDITSLESAFQVSSRTLSLKSDLADV